MGCAKMIISKELKNHTFSFDTDKREFSLYSKNSEGVFGDKIHLHFIQAFSFIRFFLRVGQKSFHLKRIRK